MQALGACLGHRVNLARLIPVPLLLTQFGGCVCACTCAHACMHISA